MKNISLFCCLFIAICAAFFLPMNSGFSLQEFPVLKGKYLGQKPPGLSPEIFAPGIISTSEEEMCISFIPGAKELYFSRRIGSNRTILSMIEKNGVWIPPKVTEFSGKYDDAEFTISHDGKKIAFISLRPFDQRNNPLKYFDIWIVERTGEKWGKPVPLIHQLTRIKWKYIRLFHKMGICISLLTAT
jgi:hypothetical protein